MSVFCFVRIMGGDHKIPPMGRLRELFPVAQFVVLSYIWTYSSFYQQYPLLVYIGWSMVFYLVNGKLVLACVTHCPMKMIHLELLYMIAPAGILAAEKMGLMAPALCDKLQLVVGVLVVLLCCERCVTYSVSVVTQMTAFLGFGFFDMPQPGKIEEYKKKIAKSTETSETATKGK